MSYFALAALLPVLHVRHVGNGANGPSSTIFCLPIFPQRGCSVGSSTSVAQQCTRSRGPVLSIHLADNRTSRDPTSRRDDRDSRRIRRSRGPSAGICSSRRDGSCRTGPWHSRAVSAPWRLSGLIRHAYVGAGLPDGRQSGPDRQFAGDEIGPARCATCFGIVVGEPHALAARRSRFGVRPDMMPW